MGLLLQLKTPGITHIPLKMLNTLRLRSRILIMDTGIYRHIQAYTDIYSPIIQTKINPLSTQITIALS